MLEVCVSGSGFLGYDGVETVLLCVFLKRTFIYDSCADPALSSIFIKHPHLQQP